MTGEHSRGRAAVPLAIAVGLVLAFVFLSLRYDGGDPEPSAVAPGAGDAPAPEHAAGEPESGRAAPAPALHPGVVRAPAQRIPDQGRLRVALEDLREGDALAVGLAVPDGLRGDGPRPVKVIDAGAGRVLETVALPVPGAAGGLRLEIDPAWLAPGRYLIQVEVAGGGPLPLRRYVLEVS